MFLIKDLHHCNNVNGVDGASTRVGKDGDEDMFFNVEWSRVEGELPARTA